MYRILDNITGKWINGVPYRGTALTDNMLADPGRVFKRRSDLSVHISQNIHFYTANVNRLEIVEYELSEVSREPISTAIKAKEARDKKKEIETKKQTAATKLREIEYLRNQIKKLTGEI